ASLLLLSAGHASCGTDLWPPILLDRVTALDCHNPAKMPVGMAGPLVYQPAKSRPRGPRIGAAGRIFFGSVRGVLPSVPAGKARQWQPPQAPPNPMRWQRAK